jgi:alpha-D-xyloside xylohydrolase
VYTGKDASFFLYEDEGTNYNYEKGAFSTIDFNYKEETKTLTIEDRKGSFSGMLKDRTVHVIFIGPGSAKGLDFNRKPDRKVRYSGRKVSISIKP